MSKLPGPHHAPRRAAQWRQPFGAMLIAAFGLALVLAPSSAAAADSELFVTLQYGADGDAVGCWDEAEFRRSVSRRIGYDPFRDDASMKVKVQVGGSASAVDGHVEWRKANGQIVGERRFAAKDENCAKLLTEMSFAVGLQIELLRPKPAPVGGANVASAGRSGPSTSAARAVVSPPSDTATASAAPSAGASSPPQAPASSPASSAPAKPEVVSDRVSKESPDAEAAPTDEPTPAPSAWQIWLGIGPSIAWRLSPGLTEDTRLFLGMRKQALSAEVAAEATYPSSMRRWDGSGFRHTMVGGTLALCGHLEALSACALGRASLLRISGVGIDEPRNPISFVAQVGARLARTFDLDKTWFLAVHLDGLGLLTATEVELDQYPVWQMPRLGFLAGIDVAARFR